MCRLLVFRTTDSLKIIKETREGFKNKFLVQCSCCLETHICSDSDEGISMTINQAVVFGALSTGGTGEHTRAGTFWLM